MFGCSLNQCLVKMRCTRVFLLLATLAASGGISKALAQGGKNATGCGLLNAPCCSVQLTGQLLWEPRLLGAGGTPTRPQR